MLSLPLIFIAYSVIVAFLWHPSSFGFKAKSICYWLNIVIKICIPWCFLRGLLTVFFSIESNKSSSLFFKRSLVLKMIFLHFYRPYFILSIIFFGTLIWSMLKACLSRNVLFFLSVFFYRNFCSLLINLYELTWIYS